MTSAALQDLIAESDRCFRPFLTTLCTDYQIRVQAKARRSGADGVELAVNGDISTVLYSDY